MTDTPTTARSQAEANLDSAQWNLGRGDRVHAAVHIAQAVAADPSFDVSYEEAERLVMAAPEPAGELFPVDPDEICLGNAAPTGAPAIRHICWPRLTTPARMVTPTGS